MIAIKNQQEAHSKLIGKRIKIVGNTTGHGWLMGTVITPTNINSVSNNSLAIYTTPSIGYTISWKDIEFDIQTVEQLNKDKVELTEKIKVIDSKIKYLEATKQEQFDETEFKVWNTLQLLKGKKNDLEKAKAIAALINS